jgi:hypothetical protein
MPPPATSPVRCKSIDDDRMRDGANPSFPINFEPRPATSPDDAAGQRNGFTPSPDVNPSGVHCESETTPTAGKTAVNEADSKNTRPCVTPTGATINGGSVGALTPSPDACKNNGERTTAPLTIIQPNDGATNESAGQDDATKSLSQQPFGCGCDTPQ